MWSYVLRSIKARLAENVAVVGVVGMVVGACVLILSFADNLRTMTVSSGDPETVIVLARGATSESASTINKDMFDRLRVVKGIQEVQRRLLVSGELVGRTQLREAKGKWMYVMVRGIDPISLDVRQKIRIVRGRAPQPGTEEVMIGKKLEGLFPELAVGGHWGRRPVVGEFVANGSLLETEVWMDRNQLAVMLGRRVTEPISTVIVRVASPADTETVIRGVEEIGAWAMTEPAFYETFVGDSSTVIDMVIVFSLILGLGASIAAANTLYSSMLARSVELATLYAIGIRRGRIGMLVLRESLLLALAGAVVGSLMAFALDGQELARLWTDDPFVHFPIHVSAAPLAKGLVVALGIGLLGGLVPVWAVRRMDMQRALG